MKYLLQISKQALKELEHIPAKTNRQITGAIDQLADNPRPIGCKKLKGEQEELWRIRVSDYRIIYTIEDKIRIVEVRKIGHRRDIYSKL